MKTTNALTRLLRSLLGDTRGEDYMEVSSGISRTMQVVLVGVIGTGVALAGANLTNGSGKQTKTTQDKIMGTGGAGASGAQVDVKSAFTQQ